MDKNRAHDIVHTFNGGKSEKCPHCLGEMDDKGLKTEAMKIAAEHYKPHVSPQVSYTDRLIQYDENGKEKDADFRTMIDVMQFSEDSSKLPSEIKLLPTGTYEMMDYGKTEINKQILEDMKRNFDEGVRAGGKKAGLPIDIEHGRTQHANAAAGWIKDMIIKSDGMYGKVEWTELGQRLLNSKEYKFYSPEFWFTYQDQETSKILKNVMTGGGLTNKPVIKHDLHPIVNSEDAAKKKSLTKEKSSITISVEPNKTALQNMQLSEIIKKAKTDRSSDEQKFVNDHKDELTFAEAKTEGFAQDAGTKTETPAPAANQITLSEGQVVVDKAKFDQVIALAERGKNADEKLKKQELREEVKKLTFSEKGTKLPTDQVEVAVELLMSMDEESAKKYKAQLAALPEQKIFSELGTDHEGTGSAAGQDIHKKAIEFAEKNKVGYAVALSEVTKANPQQVQEYNENLPVAGVER